MLEGKGVCVNRAHPTALKNCKAFRAFIILSLMKVYYLDHINVKCVTLLEIFLLQAIYFKKPQEKAKLKIWDFLLGLAISSFATPKHFPC